MRLTLLVPDLPLPDMEGHFSLSCPSFPALHRLLAKGNTHHKASHNLEETLLQIFGVTTPISFPIAAVSLHGEGIDSESHTWLRADPVSLQVMRDHIQLHGADKLAITPDEAGALIETLNHHLKIEYAAHSLRIFSASPERWYMQVEQAITPRTVPVWQIEGRSILESLPVSQGALDWKCLTNEMQMLLHDHPVNRAREATGKQPVNGIWFWGEGSANAANLQAPSFSTIYADNTLARGLARQMQLEVQPVPNNLPDLLRLSPAFSPSSSVLVVLDNTAHAWRSADERTWVAACADTETRWFSPAQATLKSGILTQLELHLPTGSQTWCTTIKRNHLWRFWRRSLPHDHA